MPWYRPETPAILDYKVMDGSLYNTPPCWTIYMCGLVFSHMLRSGGLASMHAQNEAKAQLLYNAIDGSSGFYNQPVDPACRCIAIMTQLTTLVGRELRP